MSDTTGFLTLGECLRWQPAVVWLHVASDVVVAVVLFAIPVMIARLLRRRRELPHRNVLRLVAAFLVLGGTTQVLEIVSVWQAVFWIEGFVKALMAAAAVATLAALAPLLPKLTRLPNPIVDGLTSLPNRLLFLDRVGRAIARMRRENRELLGVLYVDIDGFKRVNESLGQDLGDQLLMRVANRLARAVREVDTVARCGGDEFVILLERIDGPLFAKSIARRVLSDLERPFPFGEVKLLINATIGVVVSNGNETPEEILSAADAAMFRAKERQRGSYEFVDRSRAAAVS
jgi:diguanylate cyclase (GGDEF)-like protein